MTKEESSMDTLTEIHFIPYRILLAVRIDTFEAEIIDEIHCAPHEEFRKKAFEKLYSGYDTVVIVEIPA